MPGCAHLKVTGKKPKTFSPHYAAIPHMPEISRFFGIVIKMFFDDHNPPHFHAEYGGDLALIDIHTLAIPGWSGQCHCRVHPGLRRRWTLK